MTTTTIAPKINVNDFDLSNLGPAVVDLSKFSGKIPDLSSLSQNATATLQSLMEQMNMTVNSLSSSSKADLPSLLRNLAGKLPSSLRNDSHLVTLFNQHSSPTQQQPPQNQASFPTPKHTSDNNDIHKKLTSAKEVTEDEDESEEDSDSVSLSSSSSTTPSSTSSTSYSYAPVSVTPSTKAPSLKNVTPKTPKIPSRWSTTSKTTTSTSTTISPKSKSDPKLNKPSNEVVDNNNGDEGEDEIEDENETTPPSSSSTNQEINNHINILGTKGIKNKESSSQRYVVELKFPKAWKSSFVRKQSEDYLKFKEKIEHQVRKELSDQFSALEVKVMDLTAVAPSILHNEEDSSTTTALTTVAKLKLSLKSSISESSASSPSSPSSSSSNHPKGKTQEVREETSGAASTPSSSSSTSGVPLPTPIRLTEALNIAIKDGRFGDFAVDSTYLIVRSLGKLMIMM
jgi:hypothetical protein